MRKLGELGAGITALLEVEVNPAVDGLDHHLLSPSSGEEDEREVSEP